MSYCALARLKRVLGFTTADADRDADLQTLLDTVSTAIAVQCGQQFTPTTATRLFPVPASTLVATPALRTVTAVTLVGVDVTASVRRWPVTANPLLGGPYQALEYRPGDVPTPWAAGLADTPFDPGAQLSITGDWGWASVPGPVAEVAEIAASRAWAARVAQYASPSGISPLGTPTTPPVTLTPDLVATLAPYIV